MQKAKDRVATKIFVGFPFSMDLRIQLNQSNEWKQISVIKEHAKDHLSVVHYEKSEYIGRYLDSPMSTVGQIKQVASEICQILQKILQNYNLDALNVCLFSQVLVS